MNARNEPVGDACCSARLDDAIAELGVAELAYGNAEVENSVDRVAIGDARDRTIAGEAEEAPYEVSADVLGNPVVVVDAGLDDWIADPPVRAVQHVPVREDPHLCGCLLLNEAAERPGADGDVSDADTRQERIDPALPLDLRFCLHRRRVCLELALDHISREGDAVRRDRLGNCPRRDYLQCFGRELLTHRELQGELLRPLAVSDLVANSDRVDVRVGQVLVSDLADGCLERLRASQITLAHRSLFGICRHWIRHVTPI
ncbi:MAG TPA: hypothetical protein VFL61_01615 [Gaiellaceae bacterium]|nr:hypothetical protein [Gaiellaceae bacterium]